MIKYTELTLANPGLEEGWVSWYYKHYAYLAHTTDLCEVVTTNPISGTRSLHVKAVSGPGMGNSKVMAGTPVSFPANDGILVTAHVHATYDVPAGTVSAAGCYIGLLNGITDMPEYAHCQPSAWTTSGDAQPTGPYLLGWPGHQTGPLAPSFDGDFSFVFDTAATKAGCTTAGVGIWGLADTYSGGSATLEAWVDDLHCYTLHNIADTAHQSHRNRWPRRARR